MLVMLVIRLVVVVVVLRLPTMRMHLHVDAPTYNVNASACVIPYLQCGCMFNPIHHKWEILSFGGMHLHAGSPTYNANASPAPLTQVSLRRPKVAKTDLLEPNKSVLVTFGLRKPRATPEAESGQNGSVRT